LSLPQKQVPTLSTVNSIGKPPSHPHSGLRRHCWLRSRKSVTLSVGTPLCPNGNAYRRVYGSSTSGLFGWFKKSFCRPLCGRSTSQGSQLVAPTRKVHPSGSQRLVIYCQIASASAAPSHCATYCPRVGRSCEQLPDHSFSTSYCPKSTP